MVADPIEVISEARAKEPHPDESVKAVQAAINQVRKADARVLKIQKDQRDKTQMWETYERKLRASFLQEKKKHAEAMTKLAAELVEAATEHLDKVGLPPHRSLPADPGSVGGCSGVPAAFL